MVVLLVWFEINSLRNEASKKAKSADEEKSPVLASLGIALLGRRSGDVIEAKVPGGSRRLRVEHVRYGLEIKRKRVSDGSSRSELHSRQSVPGATLAA